MDGTIPGSCKKWYAVYTRSRAEKKVYSGLTSKNIECYLPLRKKLRKWKDRKKWVMMPVIPGYCFVRISRKEYDTVLQTNNVVSYVIFEEKAAVIPDGQINYIKQMLRQTDFEVEISHKTFSPGKKVEIIDGPLVGINGELMELHGKSRFIMRINTINTAFMADVPAEWLTAVSPAGHAGKKTF